MLSLKKTVKVSQPAKPVGTEKENKEKELNDYQKTWKKETDEWMKKIIKTLQENFPMLYPENRPKSTVMDIKVERKIILTLSWKDGRLNQPKLFLVNPSNLLRRKYEDIKNRLVDKEDNTFEYFLEKEQLFRSIHSLLTEFIEEKIESRDYNA